MKEKLKTIKIPEMDLKKINIFTISSMIILAGTILFNILGLIGWSVQFIANIFFIVGWSDIILIILVIFKYMNREDETGQLLIILDYALCCLLVLIVPLMGINTLLLGIMPYDGILGMTFLGLQIGQVFWTYITLGCTLGLMVYIFIVTRKNESIWNI
ncbi:MAG: hypothetical protein ACTSVY_02300 [Candidatus Helarchaeota archaeon]